MCYVLLCAQDCVEKSDLVAV
eukprot:COSAG02_NODE_61107_length_269_cov_0.911765_1_plen_20_part_10